MSSTFAALDSSFWKDSKYSRCSETTTNFFLMTSRCLTWLFILGKDHHTTGQKAERVDDEDRVEDIDPTIW
eukprot:gene38099-49952_t